MRICTAHVLYTPVKVRASAAGATGMLCRVVWKCWLPAVAVLAGSAAVRVRWGLASCVFTGSSTWALAAHAQRLLIAAGWRV